MFCLSVCFLVTYLECNALRYHGMFSLLHVIYPFILTKPNGCLSSGGPSPAEIHSPTPSKQPGSNMLGMASGWSSTFEPEPAGHSQSDNPEQEPAQSETTVMMKQMTSFHGVLTDYAVVGAKKYVPDEADGSPTDKVTLIKC